MVIKPSTNNFKKPGLEYVLTYFDNPGVVLPPAITSWVAQKQMPDFLNKLYCATLEYARHKKHEEEVVVKGFTQKTESEKINATFFRFSTTAGIECWIQALSIRQSQ